MPSIGVALSGQGLGGVTFLAGTVAHKAVRGPAGAPASCIPLQMSRSAPANQPSGIASRLLLLAAAIGLAVLAYYTLGRGELSLEALVRYRTDIDAFVNAHYALSLLIYLGLYVVTVALSVPGATFLTVAGGFLFGVAVGGALAVVGAVVGATLIFLVARTALGEPLLKRAGSRAQQLACGFRADAFSYLLFLRLVPAFPFFIVNLVPAFAGVGLGPFVAATVIGVIPACFVYALAGTGLDSIIATQKVAYAECVAAGRTDCHMKFNPFDALTPELIGAMVALGLLALVPVLVRRLSARTRVRRNDT